MKVALVCIAKNEENYIDEWIDYHLKLGFDDIIVYANDWKWDCDNENVTVASIPGEVKQLQAYNYFIEKAIGIFDYCAIFDVDEFLVLKKHKNIKEFIADYPDADAIAINWVLFGDNGHKKVVNKHYSVLDRFTKRQIGVNHHVKVITKINNNIYVPSPHHSSCEWVSPERIKGWGPFNDKGSDEIAQLNHYFCKTRSEFKHKIGRGRADTPHKRTMSEFEPHNLNYIDDLNALTFYKS